MGPKRAGRPRPKRTASETGNTDKKRQKTVSTGQYQYIPINEKQIRIFTLYSPSSESNCELEGSIAVEQRSEPDYDRHGDLIRGTGSYEALSYTWGSDELPCDILVDGCTLPISINLHEALLRLRLPHQSRRLWIDAICINQLDAKEKTGQVQAMWQIFGDATTVLVWLGEDSAVEDGRKSFAFCKWAAPQQPRWEKIWDDRNQRFATIVECFNAEASALSSAICLEHIEMFFSRTWFQRLWIIQEFSLASDVVMHCGPYCIDVHSILWLMKHSHVLGPKFLVRFGINESDDRDLQHLDGKGHRLLAMVDTAATMYGYQCKDPRDRIAALVSISNTNRDNSHSFSIDYAIAVEPNYIRFAKYLLGCAIRSYSHVRVLETAAARHPYGLSGAGSLPSWVPDWRQQILGKTFQYRPGGVSVMVLLAVGYEVQLQEEAAIRLRLMVSDDPNTTIQKVQTLFEQQTRDARGNGYWRVKDNLLEHGDLICYFASYLGDMEGPFGLSLTLRKSQTHKDAWVLINSGKDHSKHILEDRCLDQLRENYKCFRTTQTAIALTIV